MRKFFDSTLWRLIKTALEIAAIVLAVMLAINLVHLITTAEGEWVVIDTIGHLGD